MPCKAGHYSAGEDALFCHPCPVDSFSESGARRCTECPWGTGVETGMGRSIDDCQGEYFVSILNFLTMCLWFPDLKLTKLIEDCKLYQLAWPKIFPL